MAESRGTVGRLRFPAGLEAVAPREQDVLSAGGRWVGGGGPHAKAIGLERARRGEESIGIRPAGC